MMKNTHIPLILVLVVLVSLVGTPAAFTSAQSPDPVLVGAGDIGKCGSKGPAQTAALIEGIDGTVFTAGDDAYESGTAAQFKRCYDPTWGKFKDRTYPAAGNHEYGSRNAAPYFAYFGASAGPDGKGYYSTNLGIWHIVVLNSNISMSTKSAQIQWLQADLSQNKATCTLAIWHHPLFSSGLHGDNGFAQDAWRVLYDHQVSVVVNGHDHDYERFAPQDPDGKADVQRGIREFVVGTGGAGLYPFLLPKPNSEVRQDVWGVIKFTLHPTGYDWDFIPVSPDVPHDTGSANCVGAPVAESAPPTF